MPNLIKMSRIVDARGYILEYSLKGYKLSYGVIDKVRNVVLRLTDADGTVGWGEANPMQPFTKESVDDVAEVLRHTFLPLVLRHQRPEPTLIDDLLDQRCDNHLIAKGCISMALLDIQGKRCGVPVAKLLGEIVSPMLPVLWPLSEQKAEEDIVHIDRKLQEGFKTFMLKMGQRDKNGKANVGRQAGRISALKARYKDSVKLIADANTGWSVEEAGQFLESIRDSDIVFLEQPINKCDIEGLSKLARPTRVPLSADESLTGRSQAEELITRAACRIFSIKSSKNGGPLRAKVLCDLAATHGIEVYMNSMLELGITQAASLQLAVTRRNLVDAGHAYMSTLRLDGDPTNFASFVHDGMVYLPEGPGLGIEVDEDKVRHLAVEEFSLSM